VNETGEQQRKRDQRRQVRSDLLAMSAQAVAEKSARACGLLVETGEFQRSSVVMLYRTIAAEVDTTAIAQRAWAAGKTVLLPKVRWEPHDMIAVAWRSLDDPTVLGRYDIEEPASDEAWPIDRIDLIVLPATAYDRAGRRLGKGGGFYDRFLAEPGRKAICCGLAFTEQMVDAVCVEAHDRPVDLLVTDREVLRFAEGGEAS
jgi:5-formyltetrahydrofolate cyclo-ligase